MIESTLVQYVNNSKHTLFILCGLPYSGKSYITNQLLQAAEIKIVAIDSIFNAKGFDWNTNKLPDTTQWREIFEESYEAVRDALKQGRNVLYDSTNHTFASREALRVLAAAVGADTCVIYVKVEADKVWKRWEENQLSPSRPQISRELVQLTIDTFEEPDKIENTITIAN